MDLPETVAAVGPPPKAAGKAPPMARLRMMKKPCPVAAFQVPASTWSELTVKKFTPSRYHLMVCGFVLRSHWMA